MVSLGTDCSSGESPTSVTVVVKSSRNSCCCIRWCRRLINAQQRNTKLKQPVCTRSVTLSARTTALHQPMNPAVKRERSQPWPPPRPKVTPRACLQPQRQPQESLAQTQRIFHMKLHDRHPDREPQRTNHRADHASCKLGRCWLRGGRLEIMRHCRKRTRKSKAPHSSLPHRAWIVGTRLGGTIGRSKFGGPKRWDEPKFFAFFPWDLCCR